ncbi:MAG: MBL fold metallo-hydrolase [Acidimicrobiia bacterium]
MTFWGVRGSTPCASDRNRRYGGNTSCVTLESHGEPPIVLDLGTGLRRFGETQPLDGSFHGTALVSHLHWDHVQGLPFFVPVLQAGATLDVYGPNQEEGSLDEAVRSFVRPPYFPVSVDDLPGEIRFHELEGELAVGRARVLARQVPHIGITNGYRIEWDGVTVAYVSDHQSPEADDGEGDTVDEGVLELCAGADLLIHDAQYWPAEWDAKRTWGHCTVDYAVRVAAEAGVRRLALFHHDPAHADGEVDAILRRAREHAGYRVPEVLAAHEDLTVSFD